jgi:hypothetical protein
MENINNTEDIKVIISAITALDAIIGYEYPKCPKFSDLEYPELSNIDHVLTPMLPHTSIKTLDEANVIRNKDNILVEEMD